MAESRKRSRFDPSHQRDQFLSRRQIQNEVKSCCKALIECVKKGFSAVGVSLFGDLGREEVDLSVVALLGLQGISALQAAVNVVPEMLPEDRMYYITNIVNYGGRGVSGSKLNFDPFTIQSLIPLLEPYLRQGGNMRILQKVSWDTGIAHTAFLAPPVCHCINAECQDSHSRKFLQMHHKPITVTLFTMNGPVPATKIAYRCRQCSTNYNYTMYGSKFSEGKRFYATPRPYIEITDEVFCERELFNLYTLLSMHSWVSFSGFSEVVFELWEESHNTMWLKSFINESLHQGLPIELSRKHVSQMFFKGNVELEFHENTRMSQFKFKVDGDIEKFMMEVHLHQCEPYPHITCGVKGCGYCWTIDGNWKLTFPVCMFPVVATLPNFPGVNFPNVCTEQPLGNSAFCSYHATVARDKGYPADVKGFLSYCGMSAFSKDNGDAIIGTTSAKAIESTTKVPPTKPVVDICLTQGTRSLINDCSPELVNDADYQSNETPTVSCRKDLGEIPGKLRHYSRGHVFIVRSCGHIDFWKPIYKSESPSQVFLVIITWLRNILSALPVEQWSNVVLAYDNMCHLDSMKAARRPLPLPSPYSNMWLKITKVIDDLHIKNHKDPNCHRLYNPQNIKEDDSEEKVNLMCAEQVFSWLSRYKRILSSTTKTHHLFYLHVLVKMRNKYTQKCYVLNRKPLLPKRD